MRKILKYILGVVMVAILLLSIVYMSSEHEYDLVELEEVQTDENFINIKYEKEERVEDKDVLGTLIIEKINLNKPLYPINDKKNNIEENVTILPGSISPEKENSIIFLAAHSGPAPNSYFNDLDKLEKQDKIILNINNKTYLYKVTSIWETNKDGTIEVSKQSTNQLILTTCSKKDKSKQLIINTIKES